MVLYRRWRLFDEDIGGGAPAVKVSCSQQCFAVVTRGGGLHTWGLDDGSGRLGHGRRAENEDRDGDDVDTVEARGVHTGASADQQFQLPTPTRVMSLFKDQVVQVYVCGGDECGA